MKIRQSRYLKRLLIYSLLLGTLPVIVLGMFSYFKSSDMVQKKVNESNIMMLLQSQMRVEEVLKSIHNYYSIMANSSTVNNYLQEKLTFKNYDAIVEIQSRLAGIQGVQAAVKSASYINLDYDWIVSTDGISSVDERMSRSELMKIIDGPRNSFWMLNKPESNIFLQNSIEAFTQLDNICLVIKVPLNLRNPAGVIIVNVADYEFLKSTVQINDTEEMMVFDDSYNILIRNGSRIVANDYDLIKLTRGLQEQSEQFGVYRTFINSIDVGVSFRKSSYNGWTYVSIYSIKDITKDSRTIGIVTVVSVAIISLFIFIISLFGSTIMYNPIHDIYEVITKNIDTKNSNKNSDELTSIGEGVNTLVENQYRMAEQIKKQKLQLEEFLLIRLINGDLQKNEIDARLKGLRVSLLWKWLSILSIQIDTFEGTDFNEGDRDLAMLSVNDIICQVIGATSRFQPTLVNKVQVVLIGGNMEEYSEFKEYLYNNSLRIQRMVKDNLKLSVSIGISRPFNELQGTQIAFKESQEALMCRMRFGDQSILYFEDVQPGSFIRQPYPKSIEEELIDAINQGDNEKASIVLNMFIDNIFKEGISYTEYQICLVRLLTNIVSILEDSGESINILFNKNGIFLEELYSLKKPFEIKKWFMVSVINPVIAVLDEKRGSQYKHILDSVMNIIHEEYNTDLSLESCAARLNYHPSYIWRVLRKEMNINFSDYLAQYRLGVAKKLLEDFSISISEIADRLGYKNSQNFIRYFKRLEGITPGQYRSQLK